MRAIFSSTSSPHKRVNAFRADQLDGRYSTTDLESGGAESPAPGPASTGRKGPSREVGTARITAGHRSGELPFTLDSCADLRGRCWQRVVALTSLDRIVSAFDVDRGGHRPGWALPPVQRGE